MRDTLTKKPVLLLDIGNQRIIRHLIDGKPQDIHRIDRKYVEPLDSEPVMEDWQKANKRDRTDGMSQKAVNAYRRENPGSKLKTAVTTKPSN
jgi:urocanate hydratase